MTPMVSADEAPESTQSVAARLRLTRLAFGMKKAPWCRFVGITPQAWENVEGSDRSPAKNRISIEQALKVIRATGVDMNWIYQGITAGLPHKLAMDIKKHEAEARRKRA